MLHKGRCLLSWKFLSFLPTKVYSRYTNRYILSHRGTYGVDVDGDEDVLVVVFLFCRIFGDFFVWEKHARVSAPQWKFNSLVGFENMSKGKNSQIQAVTQILIQKPWEIQGRVDLRFCPGSIPKFFISI